MPSNFPTSLDSFTTKQDGVDDILAAHINAVQDAVVAVETNVGLSAKGNQADLSTRLNVSINPDGTLKSSAITPGPNSVNTAAIQDGAVTSAKIADGTIATADLADGAVTSAKIADGTITGTDIAPNTIAGSNLLDNSLTVTKYQDASITAIKLEAGLRANHEQFRNLAAKGTATVFPLTATDTALHNSGITNPDVPRVLSYTLKNISAGALTPNSSWAAIVGTNARGQTISENITITPQSVAAGASVTVEGTKAFATITSIQLSDGQNANWQFSIGTGDKVGLARTLAASGVYKLAKNGADVATIPAISQTESTIDLSTITTGDDYGIWYRSA